MSLFLLHVCKNILIFFSGVLFSAILVTYVYSYNFYKSVQVPLNKDILFIEDTKTGKLYFNYCKSFTDSFYTLSYILYRHIIPNRRLVAYMHKEYARGLFVLAHILLLSVLVFAIIASWIIILD